MRDAQSSFASLDFLSLCFGDEYKKLAATKRLNFESPLFSAHVGR
jgi:hypothetical protein